MLNKIIFLATDGDGWISSMLTRVGTNIANIVETKETTTSSDFAVYGSIGQILATLAIAIAFVSAAKSFLTGGDIKHSLIRLGVGILAAGIIFI